MTVDFGASDAPMTDEQITAAETASGAKVLHIPTVFGSVVLAYNLPDVKELKLDSDTVAAIFLGEITNWNDPKIAALNPGVTLPDKAIQVVHRSDSSGTTNIFTGYLTSVNQGWADKVGKGKEVSGPRVSVARATTGWPRWSSSRRLHRLRRTLLRHRIEADHGFAQEPGRQLHRPQPRVHLGRGQGRRVPRGPAASRWPTAPTPTPTR